MGSRSSAVGLGLALLLGACGGDDAGDEPAAGPAQAAVKGAPELAANAAAAEEEARRQREQLDAEYPLYGAVTGVELRIYAKPDPEATVVGWLRVGSQVRLASERAQGRGCRGGYHRLHPTGYVCAADGLEVRDGPLEIETPSDEGWKNGQVEAARARGALVLPPPARDAPLPYDYYLVKEPTVPAYHRLPSRDEQRAAQAKADHFRELLEKNPERAQRYLAGESEQGPSGTEVTARYLDHGFFVASNGTEVRASRRFVRTSQGRYVKQARLEPRPGHDFHGVELSGEHTLPLAWTVRDAELLIAREDPEAEEGVRLRADTELGPVERQRLLTSWLGMRRMGSRILHEVQTPRGPRYLRAWFAAVAHRIDRPREVPAGKPWVHVDLRQQTLVLYEGDRPVYATLVSSGLEGHETPTGVFPIRRKRVTDTMADLGPEAGDDRYRVEDVPWTQYFEGSYALHAAFWHSRFGIPRSHGCVNLSPFDAHRIFAATLPHVPAGWHGLSTEGTDFEASYVVLTNDELGVVRAGSDAIEEQAPDPAAGEAAPGTEAPAAETADPRGPPNPRGISASPQSVEPWQKRQPTEVRYSIQRGGSARFVANLFRIHYGTIERLNPGVDLDRELPPNSELVIYAFDPAKPSRSVGSPAHGKITAAAPLPEGEGRILKAAPDRRWATRRTIGLIDAVLRAWPKLEPQADPLLVGTLSRREGGKLEPHETHQSGRDVDLGYPQIRDAKETYNWRDMSAQNLDLRRTWRLLHLLEATGELDVVFIDRGLQKLLYDYAVEQNLLSAEQLAHWLEYPNPPGKGSPRVQHVPGHVDHLHARFTCGAEPGCE